MRIPNLLAAAATIIALAGPAPGQTDFFWTNVADGVWSDANNWVTAPASGGQTNYVLNFVGGGAYGSTNDFGGSFLLNGLRATNGTVSLFGGALIFTNRAAGAAAANPFIVNNSGNLLAIDNDITFNNTYTIHATNDITISGDVTSLGIFTKVGGGALTLSGSNTHSVGAWNLSGGTMNLTGTDLWSAPNNATINGNATLNLQGNLVGGAGSMFLGAAGGVSGIVNQISGVTVYSNNVYMGSGVRGIGNLNVYGGVFSNTAGALVMGVNASSVNTVNVTNGTLYASTLQIGRTGSNANGSTNFFTQTGGSVGIGTLAIGTLTNQLGYLTISNGTFSATAFNNLSRGDGSASYIYLGQGADATLPAFPTLRGSGTTAEITFDGGTLSPSAASANYMSGLSRAYITDNGATLNVALGRNITVAQNLEDAAGHSGALTKAGVGVLQLTGSNTYSGGTTVSGGILSVMPDALPQYGVAGQVSVASNAAIAVRIGGAGEWDEAMVEDMITNANMAAGSLLGFDTTSGDVTLGTSLSGPLGYAKVGANTLTLTGTNDYTGPTWIYGGILSVGAIGDAGTNSAIGHGDLLRFNGGSLQYTGEGAATTRQVELLGAGTFDITNAAATLALGGNVTGAGALAKIGPGALAMTGGSDLGGDQNLFEGTLGLAGNHNWAGRFWSYSNAVLNINGNLTAGGGGGGFFVGMNAGTSLVNHASGDVLVRQNLYLGNGAGGLGAYHLYGGNLTISNALVTGVNSGTSGTFLMTNGTLNVLGDLQVGRNSANIANTTNLFVQTGGSANVGTLFLGGNANANNTNQVSQLIISNGSFAASGFGAMAARANQDARIYIGAGADVTLPAFPTARGAGSYSEILFDGGTLRPLTNATAYMSGLTRAYITDNGAVFDTPTTNQSVTVAQVFEDAPGHAGGLTKIGDGRLTLTGANQYSGVTRVSRGEVALSGSGTLGSTAAGTVVSNGAALRLQSSMTLNEDLTLTGSGVGAGGNTYGALLMNVNGGTWTLNGAITLDGGAVISSYHANTGNITIAQGIAGTGDLTLNAGAANNGNTIFTLRGQSSYDGDTIFRTINSQGITVRLETNNALPTSTTLRLQATSGTSTFGKFALNGFDQEVAGIQGSAAANTLNSVVGGAATLSTLTVNNAADFTFNGRLGNTGENEDNLALVKGGAGILSLQGANTYAGQTLVSGGVLAVNGTHSGGDLYTIAGGAALAGTGSIGSAVLVQSNAMMAPGNSIGTFTVSSNFTFAIGGLLHVELDGAGPGASDLLAVGGALDISGATVTFTNIGGGLDDGAYIFATYGSLVGAEFLNVNDLPGGYFIAYNWMDANQIALVVVPEPSVAVLVLLGIGCLGFSRRRHRDVRG